MYQLRLRQPRRSALLAFPLSDVAMPVSIEQFLQVINLPLQLLAFVRVGHPHPMCTHFHNLRGALDVGSRENGILSAGKGLMLHQLEAAAVIDQRIACNTRLLVLGL